jgi:hypothetical protein
VAAGETPPYAEHAQAAGPLSLPVMERRRKGGFPPWLAVALFPPYSLSLPRPPLENPSRRQYVIADDLLEEELIPRGLRRSSSTCESSTTMEEGSRGGWRGSSQRRRRPPSASPLSRRGLSSKIAGPDHEHGGFLCPDLERGMALFPDHERPRMVASFSAPSHPGAAVDLCHRERVSSRNLDSICLPSSLSSNPLSQ